ncbi:MAG: right-handed parallel beta-helix repeat-containing protein [Chloroflexota bacterium]
MKKILHALLVAGLLFTTFFVRPSFASADANAQESPDSFARPVLSIVEYDIGSPIFTDYWVDAVHGNDGNNGASPSSAFRTLTAAWNLIPQNTDLTSGVRINIQPGTYSAAMTPNYWENRHGTFDAPVLFRGNGASRGQVVLSGDVNMYNSRYIYFENLTINRIGDAFHCELCDHILLRNMVLNGGAAQQAQEAIKVNQSQYVYIENSDISGAGDNAIDFVAVQYGHIVNNSIHNAGDWCAYVKGGSAYLLVEANRIYDCGTGGFTAGQGTGFQFMTPPWIQYEAYDIKVVNNLIYNIEGAGLGVNGGYNILLAYNTLYHIGARSHGIEVVFGFRSCDGQPGDSGRERCQDHLNQGGWGTTVVDNGSNQINIPNRNVYIYNNIVYNPSGFQSQWSHFAIYDQRANANNASNAGPNPATTDTNLQIRGNIIWNGTTAMPLGIEDNTDACISTDPCNETQLRADNSINTIQPGFINPVAGEFHPKGIWMAGISAFAIPDFAWDISGVPSGNLSNTVDLDYENVDRAGSDLPGAIITVVEIITTSFRSDGSQDGWILESTETSNAGGTMNATASTLNLGDDSSNRQVRSILSFATGASLPDDAIVTKVTLKLRRRDVVGGGNPVAMFQGFMVDVRKGMFGTAPLALTDFKATASKTVGPTSPALISGWYNLNLTPAKAFINKLATGGGLTQIRLRFKLDDNNNATANFLKIYSGNAGAANRPQLVIEYYVP